MKNQLATLISSIAIRNQTNFVLFSFQLNSSNLGSVPETLFFVAMFLQFRFQFDENEWLFEIVLKPKSFN